MNMQDLPSSPLNKKTLVTNPCFRYTVCIMKKSFLLLGILYECIRLIVILTSHSADYITHLPLSWYMAVPLLIIPIALLCFTFFYQKNTLISYALIKIITLPALIIYIYKTLQLNIVTAYFIKQLIIVVIFFIIDGIIVFITISKTLIRKQRGI